MKIIKNINKFQKNTFSKRPYCSYMLKRFDENIEKINNKLQHLTKITNETHAEINYDLHYLTKIMEINYDLHYLTKIMEMTKQNGNALKYVEDSTKEICLMTIKDMHNAKKEILQSANYFPHDENFNHYVSEGKPEKLMMYTNINYEKIDMKQIITWGRNDVSKHVINNLYSNILPNHSEVKPIDFGEIFRMICTYGNYELVKYYIKSIEHTNLNKFILGACENKDPKVIEYLIEYFKIDVNLIYNNNDTSLLKYAYDLHNYCVFETLLKLGANPNKLYIFTLGKYKMTFAHVFCIHGSIENIKLLINYNVNLQINDDHGCKPIYYVCNEQYLNQDLMTQLLSNDVDVNSICDNNGNMPIHLAAQNNNVSLLKYLIRSGANVNSIGHMNYTPLHYACTNENIDIIQLLVKSGADVNACAYSFIDNYPINKIIAETDKNNKFVENYPISTIITKNYETNVIIKIIDMLGSKLNLTQKLYNTTILKYALDNSLSLKKVAEFHIDIQVAKHLLKHYVLHNTNYIELKNNYGLIHLEPMDMYGMKLAHYACIVEDIAFLKVLIKDDVDVNVKDCFGNTADHYACISQNTKIHKLLCGYTPFFPPLNVFERKPHDYIREKVYDNKNSKIKDIISGILFFLFGALFSTVVLFGIYGMIITIIRIMDQII